MKRLYCEFLQCVASGTDETMLRWPSGENPIYCAPHFNEVLQWNEPVALGGLTDARRAHYRPLIAKAYAIGWPDWNSAETPGTAPARSHPGSRWPTLAELDLPPLVKVARPTRGGAVQVVTGDGQHVANIRHTFPARLAQRVVAAYNACAPLREPEAALKRARQGFAALLRELPETYLTQPENPEFGQVVQEAAEALADLGLDVRASSPAPAESHA